MNKKQWEQLLDEFPMNQTVEGQRKLIEADRRFMINTGRQKGKIALLIKIMGHKGTVQFEHLEDPMVYPFLHLDPVDADGNIIPFSHKDMLGEPIVVGSYIAYSRVNRRQNTLEIGKVKKITEAGTIMVIPWVANGAKAKQKTWSGDDTYRRVESYRALKLPVDPARLMMGILTDFDSISTDLYG